MGIEYMLSRRKDKNIYNIRWKIVRQISKRIKQFKKQSNFYYLIVDG